MNARFGYKVISSMLHDVGAVERLFASYAPLLEREGGLRLDGAGGDKLDEARSGKLPLALFVMTGGTEALALEALDIRGPQKEGHSKEPSGGPSHPHLDVTLIAHPLHNSLPAAMEILARVRQDGGKGNIVFLSGPKDERGAAALRDVICAASALATMSNLRIGAIGAPSDWLVASAYSPASVAATWGASLVPVPMEELREKLRHVGPGAGAAAVRRFGENAAWRREPSNEEMAQAGEIYLALKDLVAARGFDAVTLRCFDLLLKEGTTGCFALSSLADDGIDAGCEGDVASIVALALMRAISGKAAWMANPSNIDPNGNAEGKGEILLAHCTIPLSGLMSYGIRSHFESGKGVAIAGKISEGPVTMLRLGGRALDKAWIAEGELYESPSGEGLCRTQGRIRTEAHRLQELLDAPLGNHIVVARGHWGGVLKRVIGALPVGGAHD